MTTPTPLEQWADGDAPMHYAPDGHSCDAMGCPSVGPHNIEPELMGMTTPTPRTDEALALTLDVGHDLGPQHKPLVDCARQLERDLAAAQEARQADEDRLWSAIGGREAHWIEHHDEDGTLRRDQLTLEGALIFLHGASERSQRAEALAESYRDALNRFKEEREGNTRQFQRLQHRLAQSEADNSSLAVGQCIVSNGGLMGDEHGNLYCDMQRQRDELRGRVRVMADIMNTALDVIKTVEGDGSDEDEALMHIRAKMASAIDSVRRADKAAIDSARGESNG